MKTGERIAVRLGLTAIVCHALLMWTKGEYPAMLTMLGSAQVIWALSIRLREIKAGAIDESDHGRGGSR